MCELSIEYYCIYVCMYVCMYACLYVCNRAISGTWWRYCSVSASSARECFCPQKTENLS